MSRLFRRNFHTSLPSHRKFYNVQVTAKEAARPIPLPPSVSLQIHRIPSHVLPQPSPHGRFTYRQLQEHKEGLRRIRESSVYYHQLQQETAVVRIQGPLGSGYVPVPEWLDFGVSESDPMAPAVDIWHGQGAAGGRLDADVKTAYGSESGKEAKDRFLYVTCVDPEAPLQSRHWGFYKRRIANYVHGVVEGYALPVRFVGVGYRAQVDALKIEGPEKHDALMFETWLNRWRHLIQSNPMRQYMADTFQDSMWAQMVQLRQHLQLDTNLFFRTPEPRDPGVALLPLPKKIVMKVGYAHTVEVMVPPFLQASAPSPTNVALSGCHLEKVLELAAEMRRARPPEPYKGKGVFVGDETIVLKQKKIK